MDQFLIINLPYMIWIPLLLMFGGYVAFSILLFFFPTLLHKRMKYKSESLQEAIDGLRILRIAHRGGPRHTTQNTMEAFKKAEFHSDMFEMDVCETKDDVLIVHHDQQLLRTCGISKNVRDFNFSDLPPFKEEIQLNFAPEGLTIRSNKEKIPLLEDVFKAFPTMPMNIQLKTPTKAGIKEYLRLINEYKRNDLTISGIRGELQQQLRVGNLNGFRWMTDKEFYQLLLFWVTGLLPFIYIQEVSIQIPLFTSEFYEWKIRQWGNNWKTHLYFKGIKILNFVMQPLVKHLLKRGIMTFYWVCNTQHDIRRAIKYGACGVMTDNPELLDQLFKKINEEKENATLLQEEKKLQ